MATVVDVYAVTVNISEDNATTTERRALLGTYIVGEKENIFCLATEPIVFLRIVFSPTSTMLRLVTNFGLELKYTDVITMLRSCDKILPRYPEDERKGINGVSGN